MARLILFCYWSELDRRSQSGVMALPGTPELAFVVNGAAIVVSAATLLFVHIPPQNSLLLRR